MPAKRLVSYITVVRNAVTEIDATVSSILPLLSEEVEYIVIDGDSTDGTKEILANYANRIDHFLSEKDKGIYDAMNKGLELATGVFVCFINIGDRLLRIPLDELRQAAAIDVAGISCAVQLSTGSIHRPEYGFRLKLENTLHHQGTYYRRAVCGKYDIRFSTFADFDMNQRLYKQQKKLLTYPELIAAFHSVSGVSNNKENLKEIFEVVGKNFGAVYAFISACYFKYKYGLMRKLGRLNRN